jgi:Right handed beta helix region/Immunoglobulin I-set domain
MIAQRLPMRAGLLTAVFVTVLAQASPTQAVIYVRAGAGGANNGTSWADAFVSLQSALTAAAAGGEIWVAAGIYTPGPPGDAVSSFVMKNGVALYGGFAGTETLVAQRNWAVNATRLSGDVGQDDVIPANWPTGWNIGTSNSGHVIVASATDATAIIDGFIIENGALGPAGTGAGDDLMYGSGIHILYGSPTIRNCTFQHHLTAFASGGAIYCLQGNPTISHCTFNRNYAHLGNGAGIFLYGPCDVAISDCIFSENITVSGGSGFEGQGSAIGSYMEGRLTVTRCRFEYNIARMFFAMGGSDIARGAGISFFTTDDGSSLVVRECEFRSNTAPAGAGIMTWGNTTILNSIFHGNTVYEHPFTEAASNGGYGAGVCGFDFGAATTRLINCTVARNYGKEGVGVCTLASHEMTICNSIVWGNIASGEDVDPLNKQMTGTFSTQYSCVQDLLTPVPGEDPPEPASFPGCIVVSPQFTSEAGGNLRLLSTSPCIDIGRNSDVPGHVRAELDGNKRVVRGLGAGSPVVDMGAYEYNSTSPCLPMLAITPTWRNVCPLGTTLLAANATGAGPFTYQWRKNNANLLGATLPTLTLSNSTAAGVYECQVTNACGTIATLPATIGVDLGFQLYSTAAEITICVNQSASFEVSTSGWRPVTYQWRKDGVPVSGLTDPYVYLENCQIADGGNYDCVVTSECGSLTSLVTKLTVTSTEPVSFSQQPEPVVACSGATATFEITAVGTPPLSFTWTKGGYPVDLNDPRITVVTGPSGLTNTLTITDVYGFDSGNEFNGYQCTVGGPCQSAQSAVGSMLVYDVGTGDGNLDGLLDGGDVQGFVDAALIGAEGGSASCPYDMNASGITDVADVAPFVDAILSW